MKDRLTKLFTTFLAVVLLVGMSPAAATTAYAASWNSGGKSISSWWNNWFGSSNKNDSSNKNEQNDADVADNNQLTTNDATSGGNTKGIVLTKTAKDKGKDNAGNQIFDISLGVKGKKVNTPRPVDVTLVIDTSASMRETDQQGQSGTSKMDATKTAAKAFVSDVLKDGSSARISVVQFATNASAARFNSSGNYIDYGKSKDNNQKYYSNNATQVTNAIEALNYKRPYKSEGSTNTEGGAVMAKIVTDSRDRSDADSIVIFLTDGVPTYYSNGGVTGAGGDGLVCKNTTFTKATSAFANLKQGNRLYGIGFLTSFSADSSESKICQSLLSDQAYYNPSISSWNNWNGYGYNYANFTADTSKSANFTKYYGITKEDSDASTKIKSIYKELSTIINSLASGTIVDKIPVGFELTDDALAAIQADANAEYDAINRTVTYKNVEAGENTVTKTFEVKYIGNGYGAAYTNDSAVYNAKYYNNTTETLDFPKPVAGLHPKTVDDTDSTSVGTTITVDVRKNDPFKQLTVDGYTVSDYTIVLTDKDGKEVSYTGDFTAKIDDNRQLQFTSTTAGTKVLYYVVKATLNPNNDKNFAIDGKKALVSRPTKVTIDVYDAANQAFVIDFDKPVTYDADTVFSKSEQNATINLEKSTGKYGNMGLNGNKSITYTLTKFMDGIDKFIFNEKFSDKVTLQKSVSMIPATSVYYDDSFGSTDANSGKIVYSSDWKAITNEQANEELKDAAKKLEQDSTQGAIYGYDSSYDNFIGNSNGTVHKVTGKDDATTASIQFTGTGIDVYALTDQTGGKVYATLTNKDKSVEKYLTREYSYKTGKLFHVPVISFNNLPKDNYTLTITIADGSTFYLDGLRIYNPLGTVIDQLPAEAKEAYEKDGELGSQLAYIRDGILGKSTIIKKVEGTVYIDDYASYSAPNGVVAGHNLTLGSAEALKEYTRYGCKTETYLPAGESLTLTLDQDYKNIQLGLKSSKEGATYTINGGDTRNIKSSTDMYYKVTAEGNKIKITNTSNAMIEITALKVVK